MVSLSGAGQVEIVSVFDATLSDGIHNDSGGNMLVGARCATAALGACYGHAIAWKHPECRSATRLSATRVELTFDNVVGRLHYENRVGREFPFAVRDMDGDVPVADYALHGRQCLRLTLGRPLVGQATVTGAPTADPSTNVPFDIPGYRPMLGFTRVIRDRASVRK
jgi:sialate O-acetylesterase